MSKRAGRILSDVSIRSCRCYRPHSISWMSSSGFSSGPSSIMPSLRFFAIWLQWRRRDKQNWEVHLHMSIHYIQSMQICTQIGAHCETNVLVWPLSKFHLLLIILTKSESVISGTSDLVQFLWREQSYWVSHVSWAKREPGLPEARNPPQQLVQVWFDSRVAGQTCILISLNTLRLRILFNLDNKFSRIESSTFCIHLMQPFCLETASYQ